MQSGEGRFDSSVTRP
nr:unnamed protein product [Callosobruchus chinensis]CAH7734956.1 unnamed protein product [Callosobruchus chinensis]